MTADRDRIIEQALKHELRGAVPPAGPSCLDAEMLGAWVDGGLEPAAMASAEAHVSTCARCQAMVGTFTRANAAVGPTAEEPGFRWWKWWLAPLAAGAAAVTLWMVVPPQQQEMATPPPTPVAAESTQSRTVAPPAPAAAATPAPASPVAPAESGRVARADRAEPPADLAAGARENRQQLKGASEPKREAELKTETRSRVMQEQRAAAAEAPAIAGAQAKAQTAVPAAMPSPPPAALEKNARFAAAPLEIISPDRSHRWRIVAQGIERSEDGGVTWIVVRPASGETITGGTAPTASICWLFGRDGVVLVTADGFTFARVPLPERIDLTGVSATDARGATVTTIDGRRFRTDDSGRTWRPI